VIIGISIASRTSVHSQFCLPEFASNVRKANSIGICQKSRSRTEMNVVCESYFEPIWRTDVKVLENR
jgi:hypothetical protein